MSSFLATAAIDPAGAATTLVNTAGPQLISAVTGVLPVLIPLMLALWAIGFVWQKVSRARVGGK